MKQCDVCNKNSLFPEKFGSATLCKICFFKAGGLVWKRVYEKHSDAEKKQRYAIKKAQQQSFPQEIINELNNYFSAQMNKMVSCACCGQLVRQLHPIMNNNICAACLKKLNIAELKQDDYDDNESVERNRKHLLKIAQRNKFSQDIIDALNQHFDNEIQPDLIMTTYNQYAQKLKIYKTHCVLSTPSGFDHEEAFKEYNKILNSSSHSPEILFSADDFKLLAKNVIKKGVINGTIKTGLSIAASGAFSSSTDNTTSNNKFKIIEGDYTIDYIEYDCIDVQRANNNTSGYIRFRKSGFNTQSDHIVFLFTNECEDDDAFTALNKWATETRQAHIKRQEELAEQIARQGSTLSAADEIVKFKNLLDQGIITQEEFDIKKKELLGL